MTLILLLLSLVLLIFGIGFAILRVVSGHQDPYDKVNGLPAPQPLGPRFRWAAGLIVASLVVFIISLGIREVGAGQVGIKTRFGAVDAQPLGPGLHLVIPVAESVTTMDTRVLVYPFEGIEAFTRENQPAHLVGIVQFHIDPTTAPALYQNVGADYQQKLINSQADTKLKALARRFGVDEITSRRDELALEAQQALQDVVAPYDIKIDGVFVRDIGLSADYLASVEQKQVAQQNLARAGTEAETARTKAQGEADAQAIRADGQARANERIVKSLTPDLIQWETVHRLADKVRIALVPSDSGFIWNLNGITADASPQP